MDVFRDTMYNAFHKEACAARPTFGAPCVFRRATIFTTVVLKLELEIECGRPTGAVDRCRIDDLPGGCSGVTQM